MVVHCAAWTAVDLAEDDDKKAKVHAINADGTQNIADACKKIDAKMVYISTDYVFDGQELHHGSLTARTMHHSMYTDRQSLTESLQWQIHLRSTLSCV